MREAPGRNAEGPDPLVGTELNGKYRIQKSIARGGMGRIYYATQAPLDRPVALKVVEADAVNEQESQFLKRFLQEASILAKLQHPNVVTLFDYGRVDGSVERYFIAMEYLAGDTLAHKLKARRVLPLFEVLSIFRQIARGLREAHARGIVHRDLKPSNVILVPQGDGAELVKIVDFGIGKMMTNTDFKQDLTQEGMMVGTPRYMAPEQFEGVVSPASDLYALGTIVFQALTGSLPFQGTTLPEFMVAKFAHPIPRMHDIHPQCEAPESLEALVLRLLERKPDQRMTLDELFQYLPAIEEEVFGTSGARFAMTGGTTPAPSRRNLGDLRVPTGSMPSMPGNATGPHPMPTHGSFGYTPRPMSTSARPQGGASKAPLAIAVIGAVLLAAGAGVAVTLAKTKSAAVQPAPPSTGPSEAKTAEPKVEATTFTLAVESTPPGATVMEGEQTLGTTPLTIPIEKSSVAAGARTFVLKKDGFVAGTVVQGPADGTVKTMVALAPEPAATVKSRPAAPKVGTPSKPPATGNSDLDIRLKR